MERVTGIEPVTEAWEAFVIPFHHTRADGLAVIARPRPVKRQSTRPAPSAPAITAATLIVVHLRDHHDTVEDREGFNRVGDV